MTMDCEERNGDDSQVPIQSQTINMHPEKFDDYQPAIRNFNPAELTKVEPMSCAYCQKPIVDQYYMWVDKKSWHEACVQCNTCQTPLAESCYTKNEKLYCSQDYKQLQKCRRCLDYIPMSDYVIYVNNNPYHTQCFACDFCGKNLQSGDQYLIDESTNQIYCKTCGDKVNHVIPPNHLDLENDSISDSDISDDELFSHHSVSMSEIRYMPSYGASSGMHHNQMMMQTKNGHKALLTSLSSCDGKSRVKRPRTILTTAQRRKFKASFEVSQKPCRKVRETLAAETGLSPRVVQVWFQNQRAKMKKIARRQGEGSGQGKCRNGGRLGRKRTLDSDSDNELSSPGSYISMPTPHQGSLFHDNYRSPTSMQTSPTTSVAELNTFCHPTSNPSQDTTPEFLYDDFESSFLSNSDAFVTRSVTSSTQAPALNIETRLQSDEFSIRNGFPSNSGTLITVNGDALQDSSPQDPFHNFGNLQTLTPFPNQVQNDANPIDRLMCMQSTFFRT